MYGLQDAGAALDKMSGEVAKKMGCRLGTFTHFVFQRGNLVAPRYEDDYFVLGTRGDVRVFREDLSKHFLLKSRGVLGPRPAARDVGEISYLGRIVRWIDARQFPNDGGVERIEIEADSRHAQILLAAANLTSGTKDFGNTWSTGKFAR